MIRSMKELLGYGCLAEDGRIGHVHDFYFDDATWMIRYVVVDTGDWLPGRKVLISPLAAGSPDWKARAFPVRITRDLVERSPSIALDKPVSRQQEERLHEHFGWQPYWTHHSLAAPHAEGIVAESTIEARADEARTGGASARHDPHLRSLKEVAGYHIEADDGEIGHVEDTLANDEIWGIKYLVVDTRNWLPGRKVLISPLWITGFQWTDRKVGLDLTRDEVRSSPEWNPEEPVNEAYEKRLYDYYGRPVARET